MQEIFNNKLNGGSNFGNFPTLSLQYEALNLEQVTELR